MCIRWQVLHLLRASSTNNSRLNLLIFVCTCPLAPDNTMKSWYWRTLTLENTSSVYLHRLCYSTHTLILVGWRVLPLYLFPLSTTTITIMLCWHTITIKICNGRHERLKSLYVSNVMFDAWLDRHGQRESMSLNHPHLPLPPQMHRHHCRRVLAELRGVCGGSAAADRLSLGK